MDHQVSPDKNLPKPEEPVFQVDADESFPLSLKLKTAFAVCWIFSPIPFGFAFAPIILGKDFAKVAARFKYLKKSGAERSLDP